MKTSPLSLLIAGLFGVVPTLPAPARAEDAQLPVVDIVGSREVSAPYYAPVSRTATKTAMPVQEVPQTVDVVTRDYIEDRQASSYQEALRGLPGVSLSLGDAQRDQVYIRGFTSILDQFVDGVRDDALYYRDLSNVDRLEVLKGPASVLYGRGSAGGIINRVTKKPGAEADATLSLSMDSGGQRRVEGDFGGVGGDGGAAYRVTGAHEDSSSFRKQFFLERDALSPSARFQVDDATSLLIQAEYLRDRRLADQGLPAYRGRPVDVAPDTYYGSADGRHQAYVQSDVRATTATWERRLASGDTLRNVTRIQDYSLDRNYTTVAAVTDRGSASTLALTRTKRLRDEQGVFNQTELTSQAAWGGMKHELLYGLELSVQRKREKLWQRSNAAVYSLFNPVLTVLPEVNTAVAPGTNNDNRINVAGVYVQDLVSLAERWKLLAGLRRDQITQRRDDLTSAQVDLQRTDQVWSPRVGLVFAQDPVQTYYASASRSFQPLADSFTLARNSDELAPAESTNLEIGAKRDINHGQAALGVALFQLTQKNIPTTDPGNPTLLAATAAQRSRGLELSLVGEILPKWRVRAGYAYMDAQITASNNLVNGRSIVGNRAALTPRHSANVWISRDLGHGFSAGGGVEYAGDRFASNDEQVHLGSYVVTDFGLRYQVARWETNLTLKNAFDRKYFVSAHGGANDYNMPGAPRTLALTLKYHL